MPNTSLREVDKLVQSYVVWLPRGMGIVLKAQIEALLTAKTEHFYDLGSEVGYKAGFEEGTAKTTEARIDTASTALRACPTKDHMLRLWLEQHLEQLQQLSKEVK